MKRKHGTLLTVAIIVITVAGFLIACLSCTDKVQENRNTFTVATWNVQNLFDGKDDGTEYEEYKTSSGWNDKAYRARLSKIKTVFSYFEADTVVLNEVENQNAVQDIISTLGYYLYYTVAGEPEASIKTAIISKYPIGATHIHAAEGARPILEAEINTPNGQVHLFAVHAKSKLGDEQQTKELRRRLGEVLTEVSADKDGLVVIAGDFNEQIEENNIFCDIRYNTKAEPWQLKVSPHYRKDAYYSFNMDNTIPLSAPGTYYYNGNWESIDNIVVYYSPDWEKDTSDIVFKGILESPYKTPNKYNRKLLSGVSDHLPVWVRLKY